MMDVKMRLSEEGRQQQQIINNPQKRTFMIHLNMRHCDAKNVRILPSFKGLLFFVRKCNPTAVTRGQTCSQLNACSSANTSVN